MLNQIILSALFLLIEIMIKTTLNQVIIINTERQIGIICLSFQSCTTGDAIDSIIIRAVG